MKESEQDREILWTERRRRQSSVRDVGGSKSIQAITEM